MENYLLYLVKLILLLITIGYTIYSIYDIDYKTPVVDFSDEEDEEILDTDSRFRGIRQYKMINKLLKKESKPETPRRKLINYVIFCVIIVIIIILTPSKSINNFSLMFFTFFGYIIYKKYGKTTDNLFIKYVIPLYIIIYGGYSVYKIVKGL